VELRHLRYFRAVADELHFGRAAERLHIAQPPLSQQIRQLERELGVTLLTRTTRSVELTAAGQSYLRNVVHILDAVDDAGEQARRVADGTEGRLVIGCVGSATYSLLPQLVRALRRTLPNVDLSVRGEMLAPAQLAALHSGEIDLGLLRPPVTDPDIAVKVIRQDRLLVGLPADHPLTERPIIDIADLRDEDFISHAGRGRSRMANVLTELCAAAGFTPRIRHDVEETSTLVTLVAAGLGVAIVPEPTADLDIAGVCYRPLSQESARVELLAAHRRAALTPLIDNVLGVLREIV
jgi:DNA-binding transcriptional LysR family regulator